MGLTITFPSNPNIREYVDYYYHIHSESAGTGIALPDAKYDLVFNFGCNAIIQRGDERIETGRFVLSGLNLSAFEIVPNGHIDALGIKFSATGVYPFLRIPASLLSNEMHDATSFFNQSCLESVSDRLQSTMSIAIRTNIVEQFLISQLIARSDERVNQTINLISRLRGAVSVSQLAANVNLTERRLLALFQTYVGASPKTYARLVRFKDLIIRFQDTHNMERFSRLALDVGYYDQPHFVREFSRIVHKTPQQFIKYMMTSDSYNY